MPPLVWSVLSGVLVAGVCGWWVREWYRAWSARGGRSAGRLLRDAVGDDLVAERKAWARRARWGGHPRHRRRGVTPPQ